MKLLYTEEHISCFNYMDDFSIGFNSQELASGEVFKPRDPFMNYLVFVLEGKVHISCQEFLRAPFEAEEMCFLPKGAKWEGKAERASKLIFLCFDNQLNICNKVSFQSLSVYCEKEPYVFAPLKISQPMKNVLESVLFYLDNKIRCKHMHEIKQKKIFLIFRALYSKEEVARFFAPIINGNMDFKYFVLENYSKVKSVSELASRFNCSERSFNRKFKMFFNDSPYNWMLKQKAKHIKGKLLDKNIPLSDIIKDFDFTSPAHFTTYCKKQFGMSPSEFRKQHDALSPDF